MLRREILAIAALSVLPSVASAQDSVKIGLILPMTGQQASTGKKIEVIVSQDPADHRPGDRARAPSRGHQGVTRISKRS